MQRITKAIDRINGLFGAIASALTVLLILVTVTDVMLRYLFQAGSVAVQELEWHLFALSFLLAAAWTYGKNGHVRIDVFYDKLTARGQAIVNLVGGVFFLLPFCALIVWTSLPFVESSWSVLEGSPDPGGLPYRFILKAAIPFAFFLLALEGLKQIIQNAAQLRSVGRDGS